MKALTLSTSFVLLGSRYILCSLLRGNDQLDVAVSFVLLKVVVWRNTEKVITLKRNYELRTKIAVDVESKRKVVEQEDASLQIVIIC